MTSGRFVYLVWHRPIGAVKRSIREGGLVEQWKTERGRKEMEKAAFALPAAGAGGTGDRKWEIGDREALKGESENRKAEFENKAKIPGLKPLELHMVVGKRFWYMAGFALVTLRRHLDREVVVHFYSDGTLTGEQAKALGRLPIVAFFVKDHEIRERLSFENAVGQFLGRADICK